MSLWAAVKKKKKTDWRLVSRYWMWSSCNLERLAMKRFLVIIIDSRVTRLTTDHWKQILHFDDPLLRLVSVGEFITCISCLTPGLDWTRLFMSLTAGAGTRCMSLLSSSPSLVTAQAVISWIHLERQESLVRVAQEGSQWWLNAGSSTETSPSMSG